MGQRIAVIPAKASSQRVPNKNFREFHDGKSLLQITIDKLKSVGFTKDSIYVSCEDASKRFFVTDAKFLLRHEALASNDYPYGRVFKEICLQAWSSHGDEVDIVWAQVCDPLFNEYERCLDLWDNRSKGYDSLAVRYPIRQYLMGNYGPIGWGFGKWHVKSQNLPLRYTFPFTLSILRPQTVYDCEYMVGAEPLWVNSYGPHIDIDTKEDFEVAQLYYAKQQNRS